MKAEELCFITKVLICFPDEASIDYSPLHFPFFSNLWHQMSILLRITFIFDGFYLAKRHGRIGHKSGPARGTFSESHSEKIIIFGDHFLRRSSIKIVI